MSGVSYILGDLFLLIVGDKWEMSDIQKSLALTFKPQGSTTKPQKGYFLIRWLQLEFSDNTPLWRLLPKLVIWVVGFEWKSWMRTPLNSVSAQRMKMIGCFELGLDL